VLLPIIPDRTTAKPPTAKADKTAGRGARSARSPRRR